MLGHCLGSLASTKAAVIFKASTGSCQQAHHFQLHVEHLTGCHMRRISIFKKNVRKWKAKVPDENNNEDIG